MNTPDDGIREVPRDEWAQTKQDRLANLAATQTAGPDWDLARECWLRLDWRRRPAELRYNLPETQWAEVGAKVGVPDSELLQDWQITLAQAKLELPAHLAGAFERVAAKAAPKAQSAHPKKKRGARKGEPRLTADSVQRKYMALHKVNGKAPGPTELARAMGVDPANFNPGRQPRNWYDEAEELCNNSE